MDKTIGIVELAEMYERQLKEKDFQSIDETLEYIKKKHRKSKKGIDLFKRIHREKQKIKHETNQNV